MERPRRPRGDSWIRVMQSSMRPARRAGAGCSSPDAEPRDHGVGIAATAAARRYRHQLHAVRPDVESRPRADSQTQLHRERLTLGWSRPRSSARGSRRTPVAAVSGGSAPIAINGRPARP
jgi:hypothetical protein